MHPRAGQVLLYNGLKTRAVITSDTLKMPLNRRLFLLQGFRDEQGRKFAVYILKGYGLSIVA
jgi:hypothetical protein